jgi:hypothetical protein
VRSALGVAAVVGVVGLAALTLVACGRGDEGDEEEKPVSAAPRVVVEGGETAVVFDAATLARVGLTIEPLQAASHRAEVTAYGSVLDLGGLAELEGSFAAAAARVASARAALVAAHAEYDRIKSLHGDERAASQKALDEAGAAFRADEADDRAAEAALAALHADASQRWGEVIAGWLDGGSPRLQALLQQKERLVQLTLPAGTALAGAPATAIVRAAGGADITGHLVSPAPRTDPRMQGTSLFYAVAAASSPLPGASLTGTLTLGTAETGVLVPASAVVWWKGTAWVYAETAVGRFVRRAVPTDAPIDGGWFANEGLTAGERIVVEGAQMLLSEEGRAAVHGSEG